MAARVFDELSAERPKRHFTIGIIDDVTHLSLKWDDQFTTEGPDVTRAVFYGLGSDGTVGATKNSVKIIGENTPLYAQGYFVYDSKKAGSVTVSHLRFSPRPIQSTYLINRANFVACHQFQFLERIDVLEVAEPGATFLLNSPYGPNEVWDKLPREVQQQIIAKRLKFYVVDGYSVAQQAGMAGRFNTVLQTCFFALGESAAARAGDRKNQGSDPQDLRQTRRIGASKELGRRRWRACRAARGGRARRGDVSAPHGAANRREHQWFRQFCATGHGDAHQRQGRLASRERAAGRWHVSDRHGPLREAEHRVGDPDLGRVDLHSMRSLCAGLPSCGDSHEIVSGRRGRLRAGRLSHEDATRARSCLAI